MQNIGIIKGNSNDAFKIFLVIFFHILIPFHSP